MTAAAASRENTDIQFHVPLGEGPQGTTAIFKGTMLMEDANGYIVPAADAANSHGVIGIAYEDSAAPATNGGKTVKYYRLLKARLGASSINQAMVGTMMYVVDDQTFDDSPGTNGVRAGILVEYVSATEGFLLIDGVRRGRAPVSAAATDLASVITLANEIRTLLRSF